jgi:sarcosine oxidase subunit beta
VKLWDGLSQDLNYNVMYSARGVMMLAHNVHDVQVLKRHVHANRLNGIDNEWLTPQQAKDFCPPLDISREARYPIVGAALQRRGGTARHDAVAWGYARAAPIAACTSSRTARSRAFAAGRERRGDRASRRRKASSAPRRSACRRPATTRSSCHGRRQACRCIPCPLQALVSEPVKPVLPCVVMSNTVHAYISQSDKGELVIGAGTDQYNSYSQTGGLQIITHTLDAICETVPDVHAA